MADRAFPIERIDRADGQVNAARIECCECGSVAYSAIAKRNLSNMAHEQYFRNHGWIVGNGPRRDKCPACQKKGRPDLKVVKMDAPKAEPPREMSRDDRRIIADKLDEVYGDSRYLTPWSDSAVARYLGVPKAWVERVRDEFFGPEGSNPDFDEFIAKAAPVIADMKNLFSALNGLVEKVRSKEAQIAELERIGRRIDKEIGR